ncbi:MAG TPA: hypothetical protein VK186_20770 [Candidatus Deferrimicrobium sp.]|nr:hypothetical protein [Candidatus Kapabacteria bacterium]HLP61289.1 hypothetical protein [Candidatus Deferrimicrobium sp.]
MKKSFICCFIIFSLLTALSGKEPVSRELLSLLKNRSTDQMMMALEPGMKMEEEAYKKIWRVDDGANFNYFILHIYSSYKEKANPNERFYACYFTPIAFIPFFITPDCYLQSMYDITGKGPTPHAALVDLVVQLVEKKIIDAKWLRKKLAR